jgi:hypothetical protein
MCDNVQPGQSYETPHGAMTDEYGAMAEWLAGENRRNAEITTRVTSRRVRISHKVTEVETPLWATPISTPFLRMKTPC